MQTKKNIDLHLPSAWNKCTTVELETVARIMLKHAAHATPKHPFNMNTVKGELFFEFTHLQVVDGPKPEIAIEDQFYVVRFNTKKNSFKGTFIIYLWQIHSFIEQSLAWLDTPPTPMCFPYPEMRVWNKPYGVKGVCHKVLGPAMLMQNFSWQQYRNAIDYMSLYTTASNNLVCITKGPKPSMDTLRTYMAHVETAKAGFLASIYNGKVKFIDPSTNHIRKDYTYISDQSVTNASWFKNYSDVKFQVILFWWTGMMHYLQRTYPHCFKPSSPGNQSSVNPLELYTRSMATLEKYTTQNEDSLNRSLYTTVLQHLEDMSAETERMKAVNSKK